MSEDMPRTEWLNDRLQSSYRAGWSAAAKELRPRFITIGIVIGGLLALGAQGLVGIMVGAAS